MFGSRIEDEYVNRVSSMDAASRGRSRWPILLLFGLGMGLFFTWAYFFEIEEVTKAVGKVVPSNRIQVVQTLEGGIISEITVREGDLVEKDQVLMQIDDTGFSSQLGELVSRKNSLEAERVRLQAEASLSEELSFPEVISTATPEAVAAELEVFNSRRTQLAGELDVLRNRLEQRKAELQELASRNSKLSEMLTPLSREANLTKRLVQRKVVPEVEFLRLASRLAEVKGDLEVVKAAGPKVEASIKEAENSLESTRNAYVLTARERLAKLEAELNVVAETMRAATDRVSRTQLKSPVRGVVNKINLSTVGAVVQPGKDIMEIVPSEDGLSIEASVRPQDVAFLRPGGAASVKLTAYDYLIYGSLTGKIVRIGADSVSDQKGEQFFKVLVQTDKDYLGNDPRKNQIIPGMVATIDIQTGKNTVLAYLLKPVLRARGEAMRER